MVNFAGAEPYDATVSYRGPDPSSRRAKESWRLTCETPAGQVLATRVRADRPRPVPAGGLRFLLPGRVLLARVPGRQRCGHGQRNRRRRLRLRPRRRARHAVGPGPPRTPRSIQRRNLGRRLRSPSAGIDRYCLAAGGALRVGYPTARLNRSLRRSTRRRLRNRAILVLTSRRRFPLARVNVGMSTRTLRRRLKAERSVVVGRNRWYFTSASKSRLLFRVQRGRVREVGLAAGSITRSRLRTARLLRPGTGAASGLARLRSSDGGPILGQRVRLRREIS